MWVDTVELVDEMLDELAEAPEVAIDLEHHNMQSYRGFTCLIQVGDGMWFDGGVVKIPVSHTIDLWFESWYDHITSLFSTIR